MKVLILGGNGNIGFYTSKLALLKGYDVTIFDMFSSPELEALGAKYIIGNFRDHKEAQEKLKGMSFDVAADFAAYLPEHVEDDFKLFNGRIGHYIFVSSITVYQKPLASYKIREDWPIKNHPLDRYAGNKIKCELYLQEKYREADFPVTIVRPTHTYSERYLVLPVTMWNEPHWTIADRILNGKEIPVHGEGKTLWVVTHSEDFAKGFVGLMGNHQVIGHAFNIATDEVLTWNQIMEGLGYVLGKKPNIAYLPSDYIEKCTGLPGFIYGDKSESTVVDTTKIKTFVPGFQATVRYMDGIERSVAYYRSHPEKCIVSDEYNAKLDKMIADYRTGEWYKIMQQ